jgi:hypothetical protein
MLDDNGNKRIDRINEARSSLGLPKIHFIWCKICKTANKHLWFECTHLFCPLCSGNHPILNCNLMQSCQWCGSTEHVSGLCRDQQKTKLHAQSFRRCFICGRLGHIAMCFTSKTRRGRFRRNWRGRQWRRRRRRRRRIRWDQNKWIKWINK